MAPNNDVLQAAVAAIAGASNDLAVVTERLQSLLPTYVETHHYETPTDSSGNWTLKCQPMAAQIVRVRGFLATFPVTGVTSFTVTLGDFKFQVLNGGIVMSDQAMALFLRPSDPIQIDLTGIPTPTTNTSLVSLWGLG